MIRLTRLTLVLLALAATGCADAPTQPSAAPRTTTTARLDVVDCSGFTIANGRCGT